MGEKIFSTPQRSFQRGVTLMEILAVTAIILLLGSMALAAFSTFRAQKTMDVAVEVTVIAFARARLDTISSKDDQQYGVHLDPDKI
ncbi:MAG: prepilin-type N-terminal cleavage/methylation domain-containing protein, partial [bacterium]|nr:prepilin-type N-terminal cleavage/methylation domain-containing protein [bacterium]